MAIAMLFAMGSLHAAFGATCDRNYDASLDKAVSATILAVSSGNATALLGQMSRDGVAFGTDGPLISYATLSTQFKARTGHYCDLFACNGRTATLRGLFVKGRIDKQIDAAHGMASVFINGNTDKELDLSYRFTAQCKWEITGIGAP